MAPAVLAGAAFLADAGFPAGFVFVPAAADATVFEVSERAGLDFALAALLAGPVPAFASAALALAASDRAFPAVAFRPFVPALPGALAGAAFLAGAGFPAGFVFVPAAADATVFEVSERAGLDFGLAALLAGPVPAFASAALALAASDRAFPAAAFRPLVPALAGALAGVAGMAFLPALFSAFPPPVPAFTAVGLPAALPGSAADERFALVFDRLVPLAAGGDSAAPLTVPAVSSPCPLLLVLAKIPSRFLLGARTGRSSPHCLEAAGRRAFSSPDRATLLRHAGAVQVHERALPAHCP